MMKIYTVYGGHLQANVGQCINRDAGSEMHMLCVGVLKKKALTVGVLMCWGTERKKK